MSYLPRWSGGALACLLLLGCGGSSPGWSVSPPQLGFEAALGSASGCSDIFMYARNSADTLAVAFEGRGQVAVANAAGQTETFSLTFPRAGVRLSLDQGQNVTVYNCTDYLSSDRVPVIAITRYAQSGSATLTVTPDGTDFARATLLLEDISFQDEAGSTLPVVLHRLQLTDVQVGGMLY